MSIPWGRWLRCRSGLCWFHSSHLEVSKRLGSLPVPSLTPPRSLCLSPKEISFLRNIMNYWYIRGYFPYLTRSIYGWPVGAAAVMSWSQRGLDPSVLAYDFPSPACRMAVHIGLEGVSQCKKKNQGKKVCANHIKSRSTRFILNFYWQERCKMFFPSWPPSAAEEPRKSLVEQGIQYKMQTALVNRVGWILNRKLAIPATTCMFRNIYNSCQAT